MGLLETCRSSRADEGTAAPVPVVINKHRCRLRVDHHQTYPAVAHQVLDRRYRLDGGAGMFERRLDDGDQPDRLVIWYIVVQHGLGRQAGTQVAEVAGHDAEAAGHIVVDLAAATEALVVNGGE